MIAIDGDSSTSPFQRNAKIWIDGVEKYNVDFASQTGAAIDMVPNDWEGPCYVGMGDYAFGSAPGHDPDLWAGLNCHLSYCWAAEEYLDPAVHWDSIFDGSNKPIDIGTDGSDVSGSPPLVPSTYCKDGDLTANAGSMDNWNEIGTVPDAPSSPTD